MPNEPVEEVDFLLDALAVLVVAVKQVAQVFLCGQQGGVHLREAGVALFDAGLQGDELVLEVLGFGGRSTAMRSSWTWIWRSKTSFSFWSLSLNSEKVTPTCTEPFWPLAMSF